MRLHDFLDYWARERPEAEFAIAGADSMTYAEAASLANRMANRLVTLGCRKGTRVGLVAKNTAWYPVLYFAASKAGVVLLPVNWRLLPSEWLGILNDAAPSVLIVGREQVAGAEEIRGELTCVEHFVAEDGEDRRGWQSLDRWLSEGPAVPPEVEVGPSDSLYQMYTSGTTGAPKGAVLSHDAVTANVVQVGLAHPVSPGDRGLVVLPLFHAAVIPAAFSVICRGGSVFVLDAFDPEHVVRVLDDERISVATLVPAMLQACLVTVRDVAQRRYERLRSIYYGASPIAEETLRGAIDAFGCGFVQSYGMTEAAQALTFLSEADHRLALETRPELLLSAGRPAVGTVLRLVDPEDVWTTPGGSGEIVARGPQLMSGYWQRPQETAQALRHGWLHTGDVGRVDEEGYLFVEDRIKDMIVSGGENVYPRIVEEVLFGHPAIAEAAVIGVPDGQWGEAVKAVVVSRPGIVCTEAEILAFCRSRLGGFERPRSVDFVDALPRTATGKVLKRALREPYWVGRERRVSGA
ncbi:MAG: long-chain-fatty-acid--CoA ligase [Solirubrobacterales bacterium]|nr:long-chain-fatty-acid--CoA ligase [Solirubrobacterales bacterium]